MSEDVLPRGIQIFAPCKEIGQNKVLNTLREMDLKGS
jgi:hypothetical protein